MTLHDGRDVTIEDIITSYNHHRGEHPTSAAKPLLAAVIYMQANGKEMEAAEDLDGILSVTLGHGFPWADLLETGTQMLVVADRDSEQALRTAETLGWRFFDIREQVAMQYTELDDALLSEAREEASGRPVPVRGRSWR